MMIISDNSKTAECKMHLTIWHEIYYVRLKSYSDNFVAHTVLTIIVLVVYVSMWNHLVSIYSLCSRVRYGITQFIKFFYWFLYGIFVEVKTAQCVYDTTRHSPSQVVRDRKQGKKHTH